MKKAIMMAVLLAITAASAYAGSIEDLQYTDTVFAWQVTRTADDYSVNIDADTLDGKNASELGTTTNVYKGGGMSIADLGKALFDDKWFFSRAGDFIAKLKETFATQDRVDKVQAMCMHQDASEWDLENYAALIKADRTGMPQSPREGTVCNPGADRCIIY